MKYLGSKVRFVNDILPIMIVSMQPGQCFVDASVVDAQLFSMFPKSFGE